METIQGVRTKLVLVSYSHGSVRVPLAQSFDYTPRISERTLNEFDNLEPVQVVTFYDGIDVKFDYLDTDSKLVEAMFADTDPGATVTVDDPSNYKLVHIFANMKGLESGKIFASLVAKGCRTKGAPYTEPTKEEAKVTRDLSGLNVLKIKGAAMQYQRFVQSGFSGYSQVVPPNYNADSTMSGYSGYSGYSGVSGADAHAGTLDKTPVTYPVSGKKYVYVLKNGVDVTDETGFTVDEGKLIVEYAPDSQDIWEVFYLYSDI